VSLAAFRDPSYLCANIAFSVALATLVLAIINVLYGRGAGRACWAGFALCGWAYFSICPIPGLRESLCLRLVPEVVLDLIYPHLTPRPPRRGSRSTATHCTRSPSGRGSAHHPLPRAAGRPGASRTAPSAPAIPSARSPSSDRRRFARSAIRWWRSWRRCWGASMREAVTRCGRLRATDGRPGGTYSPDAGSSTAPSRRPLPTIRPHDLGWSAGTPHDLGYHHTDPWRESSVEKHARSSRGGIA
jgi:hypothetical protein